MEHHEKGCYIKEFDPTGLVPNSDSRMYAVMEGNNEIAITISKENAQRIVDALNTQRSKR